MRIRVESIIHPENAPVWIIVDSKGVHFTSSVGIPLALSNLFLKEAMPLTFELEDTYHICSQGRSERAISACEHFAPKFLSGPNQGKPTHTFSIWESVL